MRIRNTIWLIVFIGLGCLLSGCSYDPIDEQKQRIAVNPNDIWAYYNLGNVYKDLGRYEEAIVEYQKTIEIDPKHANAHYDLASIYSLKKEKDLAIEFLQKAIVLNEFYVEFSKTDPFLENIRQTPEYQQLINSY